MPGSFNFVCVVSKFNLEKGVQKRPQNYSLRNVLIARTLNQGIVIVISIGEHPLIVHSEDLRFSMIGPYLLVFGLLSGQKSPIIELIEYVSEDWWHFSVHCDRECGAIYVHCSYNLLDHVVNHGISLINKLRLHR